MIPSGVALAVVLTALSGYIGNQMCNGYSGRNYRRRILDKIHATAKENLQELKHDSDSDESEREVIEVNDNIYMAIGYALGNSIMVDAPEGLIIVDVTGAVESGRKVLAEFRKISKKPIKALFYTHQHPDHTWGAMAFIEDPANPPEIWAHYSTPKAMNLFLTTGYDARMIRSGRQFGSELKGDQVINDGKGNNIELETDGEDTLGLVYPNKFLRDEMEETTIAGLDVVVYHIPGETDDQIGLWIPRDKAFMCGDDFYKAFPNIYTIRGATARDAVDWYTSLDKILDRKPELLVPSHTQPIIGWDNVRKTLVAYRDGIQYVHDQTVRYMNKGLSPNDIANIVQLPEHLRLNPNLREYYGTVYWSVKGIFSKYLGWFSGDPVDLFSMSSEEKAESIISLAGGALNVVESAQKALKDKKYQWALELSAHVLKIDPSNENARSIKVEAMTSLADMQINPIARNYYMTCALEDCGEIKVSDALASNPVPANVINFLPVEELFVIFRMRYKPELCGCRDTLVVFEYVDTKLTMSVQLRNGVAVVKPRPLKSHDIKITTTSAVWKKLLISKFSGLRALSAKEFRVDGKISDFKSFLECFEG